MSTRKTVRLLGRATLLVMLVTLVVLVVMGRTTTSDEVGTLIGLYIIGYMAVRMAWLDRAESKARIRQLGEVAARYGLQPVDPPTRQRAEEPMLDAVLPAGAITCRFLAVGSRSGRPLTLSLERTTTRSRSGKNRQRRHRHSVVVASPAQVEGTVTVHPKTGPRQWIDAWVAYLLDREVPTSAPQPMSQFRLEDAFVVDGDDSAIEAVSGPATVAWLQSGAASLTIVQGWVVAAQVVGLHADRTAAAAAHLLEGIVETTQRLNAPGTRFPR
jgi:hypothetical protein